MDCTTIMEKISSHTRREVTLMCGAAGADSKWVAIWNATSDQRESVGTGAVASLVVGRGTTPDRAMQALLRKLETEVAASV
jgi:hypothetical protein